MPRHYRVSLADVIAAHDRTIEQNGGRIGIVNLGGVQSAIARPYSGYYPHIHQKSAALLHALVKNHGFADGNKRTALLSTILLIGRSGYTLVLDDTERVDDIVVSVADGSMSFENLLSWFETHIFPC